MFGGENTNFVVGQRQDMNRWNRMPEMSRDQALAMVGKPAGFSHTGSVDRDLDAHYGTDVSGRGGDYSVYGDSTFGGSASGGGGGAHSIGGVSAVNPQGGQANELDGFRRYEDQAYRDIMRRLQPALDSQQRTFDQTMVNRGIPIGSDAYRTARAQFDTNQGSQLTGASTDAMRFGLGAQAQSFDQDYKRSGLANALLRAQWSKELGLGQLGLGHAQLNEQGRQFDGNLGLSYDQLGQRGYEFDAGQDFDYWNQGNYWDFAHDRAASDDYFNAQDRSFDQDQYYNNLIMSLFGGGPPGAAGTNPFGGYGGPSSDQAALYSFLFGGG